MALCSGVRWSLTCVYLMYVLRPGRCAKPAKQPSISVASKDEPRAQKDGKVDVAQGVQIGGFKKEIDENGKVTQSLKIEAPSMTEEDQHGFVMPDMYRCDACRAVMFHLDQRLRRKQPKSRRLKQWEYVDIFDDTCRVETFDAYGLKLVAGENKLSGPALKHEAKLAAGSGSIQMGGDMWKKRLGEVCRKIVYEQMGEDLVYERFHKRYLVEGASNEQAQKELGLSEALCRDVIGDCQPAVTASAPPEKTTTTKDKVRKTKEEVQPSNVSTPQAVSTTATGSAQMEVQEYLRRLAVNHGLTSNQYLAARSADDWDKLIVGAAAKIFAGVGAQSSPEESCASGGCHGR